MAPKRQPALELFGRELARAREAAGMTGKAMAQALNVVPGTVSQWESGKHKPHIKDVERIEKTLATNGYRTNGYLRRYLEEWLPREIAHQWLDKWREIEELATSIWDFETTVVPGLLQTEDYARQTLRMGLPGATDEHIEGLLAIRLERQRILTDENPPMLVVIMDEGVLRKTAGDAAIMHNQLTHLVEMADRRNISVHIAPEASSVCAGFTAPFVIASFDGGREVAYVDNQLRGQVVEEPHDVAELRRLFECFRSEALSKRESIELIRRKAAEWMT
jgi:transcriptional regulator with XRE-family HTH domain